MGSVAAPKPLGEGGLSRPLPPELDEADYAIEVLLLDGGHTEIQFDEDLAKRATDLGVCAASSSGEPEAKTTTTTATTPEPASVKSATTPGTSRHTRTDSTATDDTGLTSLDSCSVRDGVAGGAAAHNHHETVPPLPGGLGTGGGAVGVARKRSKSLSFSQYDKYLSQIEPSLGLRSKYKDLPPPPAVPQSGAPSIFSVATRKTYFSIKRGIKVRWKKKSSTPSSDLTSCICCREEFAKNQAVQKLPCGHTYCPNCLKIMINQSAVEESKMPPRCCAQPIPGSIIKAVLPRDEQHAFLKSVLQFSTPWESRIFCPNAACGEFVPPSQKVDPKHPFVVVCRKCRARVCVMCKRDAHRLGLDCPEDWELDAVLKIGEKSGWRRCYKCRTLVELTQGCTHMTCRCKAQFCYICGGVWDQNVGCPNFCNGEEEMERRRLEEQARLAEQEAEKAAQEKAAAEEAIALEEATKRTRADGPMKALRQQHADEMERFRSYERRMRWILWNRHSQNKTTTSEKYKDLAAKMQERHAKTVQHLEDRQISAEMDLRTALDAMEKSVRIRLKHMEAYCEALGRNGPPAADGAGIGRMMPQRVVTERDLRELGQQYNLRDSMERIHQSKINVLRDRQAKQLEELLERQEKELAKLEARREEEINGLVTAFNNEDELAVKVFLDRKDRLSRRWHLAMEVLRKEREAKQGHRLAPMEPLAWPAADVVTPVLADGP